MDVKLRLIFRQLVEEIDALRQIGENFAPGLHQRRDLPQIDRRIGDRLAEPRLRLLIKRLRRQLLHVFRIHPAQLFNVKHRRGLGDAGDIKRLDQLRQGEELLLGQLALRTPAQQRHIIEHGLGQIARVDQILIAGVAVALGHLMLRIAHDRRAVDIGRDLPAEGFIKQIVLRRGGQVLAAAHDVGNPHQMVVHNVCKIVGRQAVGFQQHLILQLLIFDRDISEGGVMEGRRALMRDALTDDVGRSGGKLLLHGLRRHVAAGADVLFDLLGILRILLRLRFLLAEAVIRSALLHQKLGVLSEQSATLRLDIRPDRAADIGAFVVVKAALRQRLVDHIHRALDQTALIGVLDAKDERAALTAGDQPCIKRRAEISDVHIARGAGRKAGAHLSLRDPGFHFLKKAHKSSLHFFVRTYHIFSFPVRQ